MKELITIFGDFTPGATGIWTLVLMFTAHLIREWRETRKLTAEDRLARRDGYAKQVEMLMTENRALHVDQSKLRKEYDDYRELCHRENDQLRQMLIKVQNEVEGLRRKLADSTLRIIRTVSKDDEHG